MPTETDPIYSIRNDRFGCTEQYSTVHCTVWKTEYSELQGFNVNGDALAKVKRRPLGSSVVSEALTRQSSRLVNFSVLLESSQFRSCTSLHLTFVVQSIRSEARRQADLQTEEGKKLLLVSHLCTRTEYFYSSNEQYYSIVQLWSIVQYSTWVQWMESISY